VCAFVCASLSNLQIESVLLRLGSNFSSQKRLSERHEVKGQRNRRTKIIKRISSYLKQIDNPDQSLIELVGKDRAFVCAFVYHPFFQQGEFSSRCKTLSFILNEKRKEKLMCAGAATS